MNLNYQQLGEQPVIGGNVAAAVENALALAVNDIAHSDSDKPRKITLELAIKPERNGKNERVGASTTPTIKVSFPAPVEPLVGDPIDCSLSEDGLVVRAVQEDMLQ
jgi:hypothetical protein